MDSTLAQILSHTFRLESENARLREEMQHQQGEIQRLQREVDRRPIPGAQVDDDS